MNKSLDINVATPTELPAVLRSAAQAYRESALDLQSTWQDENAGKVWSVFANTLDRAADTLEKQCERYFV